MVQLFACLFLAAQPAALPPLVGTLSVQSGVVRFERPGKDPMLAPRAARLRVGDRLTVVESGRATVVLDAAREVWALPDAGAFVVELAALKRLGEAKPVLVRRIAAPKGGLGKPPAPLGGVIRGGDPQILPFGAVMRAPIEVTWVRAPGATKTTVEVLDAKGKRLWTQKVASGTALVLPAKLTKPGSWVKVQVLQSGPSSVSASAWVCVMTPEQRGAVEAEEKALRVALADDQVALGFALRGLWAEARMGSRLIDALQMAYPALIAAPMPSAEVIAASKWQHGQWLEKAGFAAEARAAYERAWEKGGREPELKAAIERLGGKPRSDRPVEPITNQPALPTERPVVLVDPLQFANDLREAAGLLSVHKFAEALSAADKALALLPPGDSILRLSIAQLKMRALFGLGRSAEALENLRFSLAMVRRIWPGDVSLKATVLSDLSTGLLMAGHHTEALPLAQECLALRRRLTEGDHPMVAASLNNVASCLDALGRPLEALPLHKESLEMHRRLFTGDHLDLATSMNNMASCLDLLGRSLEALSMFEASLEMRRRLRTGDSAEVATSLNNVASCLDFLGQSAQALPLFEESLEMRRRLFGGAHPDVANGLNNLALCLTALGRSGDALPLHQRGLTMLRRLTEGDHPSIARTLNNVASCLDELGRSSDALSIFEESLEMWSRLYEGDHPDVATSLGNRALCLHRLGLNSQALSSFKGSLEMVRRIYRGDHPHIALCLNNVGYCLTLLGRSDEAMPFFEQSLAMRRRLIEGDHRDLGVSLNATALCLAILGRHGESKALLEEGLAMETRILVDQWSGKTGDSGQVASLLSPRLGTLGIIADPLSLYRWIPTLRGAGLALETRLSMARRQAEVDPEVSRALGDLQQAEKAERDSVFSSRPSEVSEEAWSSRLSDLRRERQSASTRLAQMLGERDPRLIQTLEVTQEQVQSGIARNQALIEYIRAGTWDDRAKEQGPDAYAAFIVPHEGEVRYVKLAPAEEIDRLVEDWQDELSRANDRGATHEDLKQTQVKLREIGRTLYDKLIRPLGKLPGSLLVAPDDRLHALPFAALFDGKKYFVETHSLSIVGSGRDLVEKPPIGETKDAVVMAGPEFDLGAASVRDLDKGLSPAPSGTRSLNAKGEWEPLAAASDEGKAVAKLLGVEPILGAQATEARLMSVERPVVLHIATHGFFFPPIIERKERDEMLMADMTGRGVRVADSPMIRSGLVLSGANNDEELRKAGLADGWATALELSQMDLRGTELVVLSACETARGDVKGAEGVFGLQRAFRFAGAQSLIMSLFKVPDDSTRALMTSFYGKWKPGAPEGSKLKALRETQLSMLKNPATRHPRHWAGFVLMGER